MKVAVKKINTLRREMNFEVPKERVDQKMDEVLKEMSKYAKIPGFRPGKAPKDVVKKTHEKTAREEMLKSLIPQVYQEGLMSEKLDPIDFPSIDQVDMTHDGLKFRAIIDLRPEVQVKDYKGIKLTKKSVEVTDEELEKTLGFFKKSRGMDEKAELNDDFAKTVGFPNLEDFKKAIKSNMEFDKQRQNRSETENQLIDELLKKATLEVPESLVLRQTQGRMEDFYNRMKQYGSKDEDIKKRMQEQEKEIKEAAQKDVKLFLVLQKIAQIEKITAGEKPEETLAAKVMELLYKEAKWEENKA